MTFTGVTTAPIASASYSPPYKYVTNYPPAVQVTGTVTGPVDNNPTSADYGADGGSKYGWAYLNAHMMSDPSYRYAYILWFILALIALFYIIAHQLRLAGGSLGIVWARWSMRRHTIGSKKPGRRNRALPSNGTIVTGLLISAAAIVMSLVGADYIAPNTAVFNLKGRDLSDRSSSTAPRVTVQKSFWTLGSRFGFISFALMPLVVLFAIKSPPVAFLSLRPLAHLFYDKLAILHRWTAWLVWGLTTVHVVLWTIQLFEDSYNGIPTWVYLWMNYRFIFGAVAYLAFTALMVLSTRPFRKHKYEFFYISHVVLVALTIGASAVHHPVLWYWMAAAGGLWVAERAYRYLKFKRINGMRSASKAATAGPKYSDLNSAAAYNSDIKQPIDFGGTDPHGNDGAVDKTLPRLPRNTSGYSYDSNRSSLAYYDDSAIKPLDTSRQTPYADPYGDGQQSYHAPTMSTTTTLVGEYQKSAYDGQQKGVYDSQASRSFVPPSSFPRPNSGQNQAKAPPVPVGYAQAQLLPSRTVRLTINVPHMFKWAAGQSCLLHLPELSKYQSHPFTILNNSDNEIVLLVKARKGLTRKLYETVRYRSLMNVGITGPTDQRLSLASVRDVSADGIKVPPVHIQARVDGPFGSSARVHWNEFSSVTIICGGSGVSFGAAVCDYICKTMAHNTMNRSKKYKTRRVRFCWVARNYAEIAWVAGQLYRCSQMVTAEQLQISIFVTHAQAQVDNDNFAPPRPGFATGHSRRDSQDSVMSAMSRDGAETPDFEPETGSSGLLQESISYSDVIDLTNYDDEEDINDPAEMQLSDKLQHQGKIRRARTRKASKGYKSGRSARNSSYTPSAYPPNRHQSYQSPYDDPNPENQYAAAANGQPQSTLSPPSSFRPPSKLNDRSPSYGSHLQYGESSQGNLNSNPYDNDPRNFNRPISGTHSRNESFRSISDSTYGRYDPYSQNGGRSGTLSPAPSIFLDRDDAQSFTGDSVRGLIPDNPRTGSMVLLEEGGGDPNADAGLWIDQADYAAMNVMSEVAKAGKPKLATVLEEEIARAEGRIIVATCGPVTLNTVVRNLVGRNNSVSRLRHGDKRGHVAIYSEDYES